jgi:diketogulonate reductase-like aldo/keto reductase
LYHLKERAIEHAVLPWCEKHGTAVVAYTPFGETRGIFTGRGSQAEVLHAIAAVHGATARQVALAFLLRHRHTFVIPKAAGISHVEENAAAGSLQLNEADLERIDAVFPRGKPRRGLPMI